MEKDLSKEIIGEITKYFPIKMEDNKFKYKPLEGMLIQFNVSKDNSDITMLKGTSVADYFSGLSTKIIESKEIAPDVIGKILNIFKNMGFRITQSNFWVDSINFVLSPPYDLAPNERISAEYLGLKIAVPYVLENREYDHETYNKYLDYLIENFYEDIINTPSGMKAKVKAEKEDTIDNMSAEELIKIISNLDLEDLRNLARNLPQSVLETSKDDPKKVLTRHLIRK